MAFQILQIGLHVIHHEPQVFVLCDASDDTQLYSLTTMATMALAVRCSRVCVPFSVRNTSCQQSAISSFSTGPPSFFNYNSARSRRRRQRLQQRNKRESAREKKVAAAAPAPKDVEDNRSVRDILFPQPFENSLEAQEYKIKWPTSLSVWRQAFSRASSEYQKTWEGFFASQGFLVHAKDEDPQINTKEVQLAAESKKDEVTANVKRNVEFVKEESTKLRAQVREQTGIHTTEDLRRFAGDMMKLASECVKEFMTGYRKGRDDETEKMLTQYFQELDDKVNKPQRRRKPKRRVLKP